MFGIPIKISAQDSIAKTAVPGTHSRYSKDTC